MKHLFQQLIDLWRGLENRLQQVESNLDVKRYGEPARKVERLRAIGAWRDAALEAIRHFRDSELPKLRADQSKDVAAALEIITRGGLRQVGDLPQRDSFNADVVSKLDTFERALLSGVDSLARQMEVSNSFALYNTLPSDAIGEQVEGYLAEAKTGLTFPFRAYAIARVVLPAVLRGRAAANDHRAGMVLETFPQIERALIERAAPGFSDSDTEDLAKCEQVITEAIRGQGTGAEENIAEARRWFGFLERGLTSRKEFEEANPPLKFPKPKPEFDANPLAVARAQRDMDATPISRLWS